MKGFTLLELLVVIAVLAFVTALAVPRLGGSTAAEMDAAVRVISSGLRHARSEAVTRGEPVRVVVDLENKRIGDRARMRPLPRSLDYRLVTARSEQLGESVGNVRFFPDGSSTGGRITASDGRAERVIDVDWLTGRVRVIRAGRART